MIKMQNVKKSVKTNTPTTNTGSTTLATTGDSFMFVKTGGIVYARNVFVGFERTDSMQVSNIFSYSRYSAVGKNEAMDTSESNFYWALILDVLDIVSLKMIDILICQLIGH